MGDLAITLALIFIGCCIRDAGARIHDACIQRAQAQKDQP